MIFFIIMLNSTETQVVPINISVGNKPIVSELSEVQQQTVQPPQQSQPIGQMVKESPPPSYKHTPVSDEQYKAPIGTPVVTLESLKQRVEEKKQERFREIIVKMNMKLPNALLKMAEKMENRVILWRTWLPKDQDILLENQDKLIGLLNLPEGVSLQIKRPKRTWVFANVYAYIK